MKLYRNILLALFVATAMVSSCGIDIDDYKTVDPDGGETLVLALADTDPIVLNESQSSSTALELSWTSGSNFGTGRAIDYSLDIDRVEGDWSAAWSEDLGRNTFSRDISVEELNTILSDVLDARHGLSGNYKVRISASVYGRPDLLQTSEVSFTATTYSPAPMTLFVIGDITEGGWDVNLATAMTRSRAAVFTYEAKMTAGSEYRFIVNQGSEYPAYVRAEGKDAELAYAESTPVYTELNFSVPETSIYRLTANLLDLTVTLTDILPGSLYMIGDATPGGWDLASLSSMEATDVKGVFSWTGVLRAGGEGFKFVTSRNFWPGYVKASSDADDMSIKYAAEELPSEEDLKFTVAEDATYTVEADIINLTVKVTRVGDAPLTNLWIIGDASPVGWSLDDAAASDAATMTPLAEDPEVFTWTGNLTAGEFKISCDLNRSWTGNWFMPVTEGKALAETDSEQIRLVDASEAGSVDWKWRVTEQTAGSYTLRVNTRDLTMTVVKNN